MKLTEKDVEMLLCETIKEVQELSGEESAPVNSETHPVTEVSGLDSLRGVEIISYLEGKLGCEINAEGGCANLFVTRKDSRALSVGEIAGRVFKILNK